MAKGRFISGLVAGAILGIGIGSSISGSCTGGIFSKDLSDNVVNARIMKISPVFHELVPMPSIMEYDDSLVMAYVEDIGKKNYKFLIPTKKYFACKQLKHVNLDIAELVDWVTYKDDTIAEIAHKLTEDAPSKEEKAQLLLDYVHSHIYDGTVEERFNYSKYPIETIVERCGDCEDFSILGAALMKAVGIDVALVHFPAEKGEDMSHVGLAVGGNFSGNYYNINEKKYYYAETTGTRELSSRSKGSIGQVPFPYTFKKAEIFVID